MTAPVCAGPLRDWWTSDDVWERLEAAKGCVGCPLLVECRSIALARREKAGVWGGVDFDRPNTTFSCRIHGCHETATTIGRRGVRLVPTCDMHSRTAVGVGALTAARIDEIGRLTREGYRPKAICKALSMPPMTVAAILRRNGLGQEAGPYEDLVGARRTVAAR